MLGMVLCGAVIGAALFGLLVQLRPPKVDPLVLLARFDQAQTAAARPESMTSRTRSRAAGLQTRVGERLAAELAARGISYTSLRQDLALTGRSYEATLGKKVLAAVGGFLIGLIIAVEASNFGFALPIGVPLAIAVLFAAGLFFIPDVDARQDAQKRRREFKRALGAYLDWVSLQMSGKAAPEQALPDAAKLGSGWPLALIRHTVTNAARSGRDVWQALTELGQRIGVVQLTELGNLVQLVAHDGAQVRETLRSRAASLRAEELADAEGTAGKRDQSMLMAQILLGVGFAVFLGYPAVVAFSHI